VGWSQKEKNPMFAMQRVGSMVLMSLLLAACGSADEPRPPPPPVEETVFRDVAVTPLEKAKNVQNVVDVMQQKARDVQNVVDEQKRAVDAAVQRSESDQ
jgi:hypothetical protein